MEHPFEGNNDTPSNKIVRFISIPINTGLFISSENTLLSLTDLLKVTVGGRECQERGSYTDLYSYKNIDGMRVNVMRLSYLERSVIKENVDYGFFLQ